MDQYLPKPEQERIACLDVIRGVAVCGLVPINILDFAPAGDLFVSPKGLEGFEFWLWHLVHLFGSGKFMSLFALLVGAGIILATQKRDAAGLPVATRYLPRLGWLWFFGMLHAYFIWHGDILVAYAVTGFVLFWCRKWPAKIQACVGVAMLAVFSALVGLITLLFWFGEFDLGNWSELEAEWNEDLENDLQAFRGSWLEQMPTRALYAVILQLGGIPFLVFWIAGGMMFLGMSLMKSGFFQGKWPASWVRNLAVAGVATGSTLGLSIQMSVTGRPSFLATPSARDAGFVTGSSEWNLSFEREKSSIPISAIGASHISASRSEIAQ